MKELLKQLGIKKWSLVAFLALFALWPLPGFKDNPTGLLLAHNHAERYINRNKNAIITVYETTIAMDERKGLEWRAIMLEKLILEARRSNMPKTEKEAVIQGYEFRLERENKRLDKKNDKIDDLQSEWNNYGIAKSGDQTSN